MDKMQFPLNAILLEYNPHCIKIRYSIEPRERRYVKGYGFLSFANNIGKNLSNKYAQKLIDTAKKICNRCIKNCYQTSNSKNS